MSDNLRQEFRNLHKAPSPLILNNVWDAASAKIMEEQKAQALATSSAALGWSLGYSDGYLLPFDFLLDAIARIVRVISIPLSVDVENGYSEDPELVAQRVYSLYQLGITGINIEDGNDDPDLLCQKISAIRSRCPQLFINARTDVYLLGLVAEPYQQSETLKRLKLYRDAGSDGLFIPGLSNVEFALEWQQYLDVPVNLMAADEIQIKQFKERKIARISTGPGTFINAYNTLLNLENKQSLDYQGLNDLFASQSQN